MEETSAVAACLGVVVLIHRTACVAVTLPSLRAYKHTHTNKHQNEVKIEHQTLATDHTHMFQC